MRILLYALFTASCAFAQQGPWAQCGGEGWTGGTTCVNGYVCTYSNQWYSQCLPGTATSASSATDTTQVSSTPTLVTSTTPVTSTTTSTSPSATASTSVCSGTRTKFKYFGVNQSCAEFTESKWPGVLGIDYIWPSHDSIDFFIGKGMNTFRVAFLMERISPPLNGLTGAFDETYLAALKSTTSYITSKGAYAVLDPHNYMRYNHGIITSTSDFQLWWKNLAAQFKDDSRVIFDVMNEPYEIPATTVAALNQAAINGIRAGGATSQLILLEGTAWTGAWSWTTSSGNGDAFKNITDPSNNFAIEMHQYLDSDGSGKSGTCVSSTVASERFAAATAWLKANNLRGFLGEFGGGSNDVCIAAIKDGLCSLQQSGVWIGALWWAAGPWWHDYFQSIEPPNGPAIARILPEALLPFL